MTTPDTFASQMLWAGVVTTALVVLYKISSEILRRARSPLGDLPGPRPSHWFFGNFTEIGSSSYGVISEWTARWGPTLKFYSVFRDVSLCTVDSKAVNYILSHSNDYRKPAAQRDRLALVLGEGVLLAEGDAHKYQRKVLTPAFGPIQIRALTEIFNEKSLELRDVWRSLIAENKTARVDATSWLSKATLDIIGLAGFNYDFASLDTTKETNELSKAFSNMFKSSSGGGTFGFLRFFIPFLNYIPTAGRKRVKVSQATMARVGNGLLARAKAALATDPSVAQGRDLLSLLVHANTATDLPPSQRLSDKDVLAQVPTFLVAGHETTSTATSWALYCLTQAPDVQHKLREELLQVSTDSPSMEELNSLLYLEHFLREVLRLHPPVSALMREATKDDVIPLDTPVVDKYGRTHESVKINKGSLVLISVMAINKSATIWGPDALKFKPERWESIPDEAHHNPGVWGNQLTFSTGPRACIGYKFSLVETKAILFALIRAFEFELAVPGDDIKGSSGTLVQRPFVVSEKDKGVQLPLIIKPYVA